MKQSMEADIAKHVENNANKIQAAAWSFDQKAFWKLLKPCYQTFTPAPHAIQHDDGDMVADPTQKKRAFQAYLRACLMHSSQMQRVSYSVAELTGVKTP